MNEWKSDEKVTAARVILVREQPFLGMLCLYLTPVEAPHVPVLATDGRVLLYNPTAVDKLSIGEVAFGVAHEVIHCIADHIGRKGNRDMRVWQLAADYVANGLLIDGFLRDNNRKKLFVPLKGILYDSQFKDMGTEEVYDVLMKDSKAKCPRCGKPLLGENKGKGCQCEESGDSFCGKEVWGEGAGDFNTENGFVKREDISKLWKTRVVGAYQQMKNKGNLPGWIERFVNEIIHPKVSWRQTLREYLDVVFNRGSYCWYPFDRRFIHNELYLPDTAMSEEFSKLYVAVDTSGSVSSDLLKQFISELFEILNQFKVSYLRVLTCDGEVTFDREFSEIDDAYNVIKNIKIKGGGGTDFRPVFEKIKGNGLLIYLTDGMGTFPEEEHIRTLWVIFGKATSVDSSSRSCPRKFLFVEK